MLFAGLSFNGKGVESAERQKKVLGFFEPLQSKYVFSSLKTSYHRGKPMSIQLSPKHNSHLIQEVHFAGSENLIAKNVFGEDEGLPGFRSRR